MVDSEKELDIPEAEELETLEEETPQEEEQLDEAAEPEQIEETESEPEQEAEGGDEEAKDSDELVVNLDDEPEPEPEKESSVIRNLRKRLKDEKALKAKNRELEEKLKKYEPVDPEIIDPGKPPEMSDPDVDYDNDKFAAKMREYVKKEQRAEEYKVQQQRKAEAQQVALQERQAIYNEQKNGLGRSDFKEAEDVVVESLSIEQQDTILRYANDKALLVYALGKNPDRVEELSKIDDRTEFALAIRDIERSIKPVRSNKKKISAEKPISGAGAAATSKSKLERLEAEADKTGDRTALQRYKRQLKNQSN